MGEDTSPTSHLYEVKKSFTDFYQFRKFTTAKGKYSNFPKSKLAPYIDNWVTHKDTETRLGNWEAFLGWLSQNEAEDGDFVEFLTTGSKTKQSLFVEVTATPLTVKSVEPSLEDGK